MFLCSTLFGFDRDETKRKDEQMNFLVIFYSLASKTALNCKNCHMIEMKDINLTVC